jgi:hypothetical protein
MEHGEQDEGRNPSEVGEVVSEGTSFQYIFRQVSTVTKPLQLAQRWALTKVYLPGMDNRYALV